MSGLRVLSASVAVLVFATFIFVSPVLADNNPETAFSVITAAENAVTSAYEAVLEAEKAGGNVSSLVSRLNEAGEFLAAARMSYENGDFDNAIHFANLSRNIGEKVKNSAYELKDLARNERVQHMQFTMLGSVFGTILVVFGSVWVWRFLKRRYR